ncbi:response regulator transcription factor [Luteolibacter sp. GHJ8]|uniref:Response regulator transcription factor n=1 Tax=Luteolibacter rhizosphaerae TaxID=2989719 RepID=A0ABT3G2I4_9BACT|nr:response regulator transcription factor [Luteolibacter rhizosphaerae]MCW1914048.1 response regulator transcription factor [Luteolibacter rhizosphaerae]
MPKEPATDVAIVEDNAALGSSLRKIVESAPDCRCVGVWTTAEDALKKIDAFRPHVVLMDINLPGMSGIEATARVKQHLPDIQVIMVTVYRDHDKIFAALKAGASGYLLKRSTPSDVRDAIRDVRSGGAPMSAEIARRVVEAFHQPAKPEQSSDDLKLSKRETEILELLCEGLANKEIADRLNISVETVRVHLKHVYEKLHVRSRTEAAMKFRDSKEEPRFPI